MFEMKVTVSLDPLAEQLGKNLPAAVRKLEAAVLRSSEPFVPYRTGRLCASGHASENIRLSGSGAEGEVSWDAPYASQCYTAEWRFGRQHHPLACARWFEAAKAAELPLWIDAVRNTVNPHRSAPGTGGASAARADELR